GLDLRPDRGQALLTGPDVPARGGLRGRPSRIRRPRTRTAQGPTMKRTPSRSGLSVAITTLLACQAAWAQQPEAPGGQATVPSQATIVHATIAQAAAAAATAQATDATPSGQPASGPAATEQAV